MLIAAAKSLQNPVCDHAGRSVGAPSPFDVSVLPIGIGPCANSLAGLPE